MTLRPSDRGTAALLREVGAVRPLGALQETGDACAVCGADDTDLGDSAAGSWLRVCTDADACVSRRLTQMGRAR